MGENAAETAELEKSLEQNAEAAEKAVLASQEQSQKHNEAQEKKHEKAAAQEKAELALNAAKIELTAHFNIVSNCKAEVDKFDEILAEFKFLATWSLDPPPAPEELMAEEVSA